MFLSQKIDAGQRGFDRISRAIVLGQPYRSSAVALYDVGRRYDGLIALCAQRVLIHPQFERCACGLQSNAAALNTLAAKIVDDGHWLIARFHRRGRGRPAGLLDMSSLTPHHITVLNIARLPITARPLTVSFLSSYPLSDSKFAAICAFRTSRRTGIRYKSRPGSNIRLGYLAFAPRFAHRRNVSGRAKHGITSLFSVYLLFQKFQPRSLRDSQTFPRTLGSSSSF